MSDETTERPPWANAHAEEARTVICEIGDKRAGEGAWIHAEDLLGAVGDEVELRVAFDLAGEDGVQEIAKIRERVAKRGRRIISTPDTLGGANRIEGTRIPTSAIWAFHDVGGTTEQILAEYPTLRKSDVEAAVRFEGNRRLDAAAPRTAPIETSYTRAQLAAAVDEAHGHLHRWEAQAGPGHPLKGAVTAAHEALHRVGAGLPRDP